MTKIHLSALFQAVTNEPYCVIKPAPELPEYSPGADIDIFCYDPKGFAQFLLDAGNSWIKDTQEIKITEKSNGQQIYIDFLDNHRIELRFDLYGSLPRYTNVLIRPALFQSVIENSQEQSHPGCTLRVPSAVDDLLLRYIEYQEWYGRRPDKIKHAEYIESAVEAGASRKAFLDKLHHYTALPTAYDEHAIAGFSPFRTAKEFFLRVQKKTPLELLKAILRRLQRLAHWVTSSSKRN